MNADTHILIVEDDPDGQALVAHILEYLNIPTDVVGDAEQAIDCLLKSGHAYRAAIIDLALPGQDGWGLLRGIHADPTTSHLPCIAVTAYHTSTLPEETRRAGFAGYFPKPLDVTLFASELEKIIS